MKPAAIKLSDEPLNAVQHAIVFVLRMRVKASRAKVHERIPPLNAAGPAQRASPTLILRRLRQETGDNDKEANDHDDQDRPKEPARLMMKYAPLPSGL